MSINILIIDDEPILVKGIRFNLEHQDNYYVDVAYDGEEGLKLFSPDKHDLVLLDLMLPKIDGFEVCQQIRAISNVPIIMLSAKGDDMDKIMGLEYGADDYITKPFNMLELKTRIKTVLRRSGTHDSAKSVSDIVAGDMTVFPESRTVEINGEEIYLTAKEFDLLFLLITHKGKVYSRDELSKEIWKNVGDIRTVDVHVRRLREKLEIDPAKPDYILTKWGIGYYFATI